MEDINREITFRGAAAVRLASQTAKNLRIFYYSLGLYGDLYRYYGRDKEEDSYETFLKTYLKTEKFLSDFINLTEFSDDEINVIMGFDRNSDGVKYTPAMIEVLEAAKIKKSLRKVMGALFNLDFCFLNSEMGNEELDIGENWKQCAKVGNPNIEIRDLVNL
jgi:hypothetical protein